MIQSWYEPHIFQNPLFPFYFDKNKITPLEVGGMNWHSNIEIIYCVSGQGSVDCDTRSYPISKGDIVVINTQISHGIKTDSQVEYYYLIIDDEFCKSNGINTSELIFTEYIRSQSLVDAFLEIVNTIENKKSFSETYIYALIRSKVLQLLIAMCDCCLCENIERNISNSMALERVKETMIYIQTNSANKLTLDLLASNVGVCKNHLAREFKKYTKITIVEYINSLRCKNAQRYILNGENVASAASLSGFDNLSYFSRTYKKHIGFLPSETLKNKQGY
jgi:AraC-like DNA-binding protein